MLDRCEVAFWHFSHLNELKVLAFVEHLTDAQFFALDFIVKAFSCNYLVDAYGFVHIAFHLSNPHDLLCTIPVAEIISHVAILRILDHQILMHIVEAVENYDFEFRFGILLKFLVWIINLKD